MIEIIDKLKSAIRNCQFKQLPNSQYNNDAVFNCIGREEVEKLICERRGYIMEEYQSNLVRFPL